MPLIKVGAKLPSFVLPDQSGRPVALKSLLGGPLVLYAYPKADTSSCTKQACAFNEALAQLGGLKARVVGVSPDEPAVLAKFAKKYTLGFTLLGDPAPAGGPPKTLDALGVWGEKSMYGKTYMGVIRTTYVLDAAGVVTHRFDAVKVPGHAEEVLAALGGDPVATDKRAKPTKSKPAATKPAKAKAGRAKVAKKVAGRTRGGRTKSDRG